MTEDVNIATAL